jgi:hypothetical protein
MTNLKEYCYQCFLSAWDANAQAVVASEQELLGNPREEPAILEKVLNGHEIYKLPKRTKKL